MMQEAQNLTQRSLLAERRLEQPPHSNTQVRGALELPVMGLGFELVGIDSRPRGFPVDTIELLSRDMLPFKKLFKNDIMMFNGKRLVVCDLHPTRLGRVERMERGVLDN